MILTYLREIKYTSYGRNNERHIVAITDVTPTHLVIQPLVGAQTAPRTIAIKTLKARDPEIKDYKFLTENARMTYASLLFPTDFITQDAGEVPTMNITKPHQTVSLANVKDLKPGRCMLIGRTPYLGIDDTMGNLYVLNLETQVLEHKDDIEMPYGVLQAIKIVLS